MHLFPTDGLIDGTSVSGALVAILLLALLFDFINGFHDAANATATLVATQTLKHWQAVLFAATFNFLALFFVSGGVAATVGAGLIELSQVTLPVIGCALLGAIVWNLFTWWRGLPSSSSHALLGSYAGAAFLHSWQTGLPLSALYKAAAWLPVLAFIVVGPLLGYALARLLYRAAKRLPPGRESHYRALQLAGSALLSFSHGANDAQKTAGIIAGALAVSTGSAMGTFHVPFWVLALSYTMMALGTLAGGWRIAKTMGFQIAQLTVLSGAAAQAGAALSIALATWLRLPVSSTLATTGAINGVGKGGRAQSRSVIMRRIALSWVLTLPCSFALGALLLAVANQFFV